jgi:hypothetical protein
VFAEDVLARWRAGWRGDVHLEMVQFDWPGRNGRPLIVMRYYGDGRKMYVPEADNRPMDKTQRMRLGYDPDSLDGDYTESVVVVGGQALKIDADPDANVVALYPQTSDRYVLLQCDREECWVMFAPWVQL